MKTRTCERLTEILESGVDVHRCAAARALGEIKLPQYTTPLVKALLDEDSDVRTDAAIALGMIGDPETAEKLMDNLLGDPEIEVKKAAIEALIAMQHQPVVPLLKSLVVSRSEELIAWDEGDFYADGWDGWIDIQMAAIKGLEAFAPEDAVESIVQALTQDPEQDVVLPGLRALAKMGQPGALAIVDFYGKGNERMCNRIARAVVNSDNPFLSDLKSGLLNDALASVRKVALEGMDKTDSDLAPLFSDTDPGVRAAVVAYAGRENILLLWDLINDPAPEVRANVFRLIAAEPDKFQDDDLIKAVQKTIKGDPVAAKEAVFALVALKGPKAVKGLLPVIGNKDVPREFRVGVLEAFEVAGDIGVPALLAVAGDEDRELRLASMTVLAQIAAQTPEWPNAAADGLLQALAGELVLPPEAPEEPEEDTAEKAPEPSAEEVEKILSEIDDELPLVVEEQPAISTLDAIKANKPEEQIGQAEEPELDAETERMLELTKTRKHAKRKISWDTAAAPHQDAQRFSARLLGGVVNDAVTQQLVDVLARDPDEDLRTAVLFSLVRHAEESGNLPDGVAEQVLPVLDQGSSEERVLATRILARANDDLALEKLQDLLTDDDPLVRVEAVRALDTRNVVADGLIESLNDKYLGVGIAAARSLARQYGNDAVDSLVLFAVENDGTYRRDIGNLLAMYAPEAGAEKLLEMLSDESLKPRWLVAIDALAELFRQREDPDLREVA
jgi:HEAT repeat protein